MMTHIAAFASGQGSNLEAIMKKIESGAITGARISVVVSNNSRSSALDLARRRGIEVRHISSATHPNNDTYAEAILESLRIHNISLVVLAGYMKKLPESVVREYSGRILNIHPALLPRFGGKGMYGAAVHRAVLESGEKETGVTVHYVDEGYDTGPVIRQQRVPVMPGDTPEILASRVLEVEHDLYWRAINDMVNENIRAVSP